MEEFCRNALNTTLSAVLRKGETVQVAEAWETGRVANATSREGRVLVTLPRKPRPLVALLLGNGFDVSRAGAPSPFANLRDGRGGS